MFTGIVTHLGRVESAERRAGGDLRLVVLSERPLLDLTLGGSVLVDGVCLTLVDLSGGRLAFDVVPETLRRTTLGAHAPGRRVNLERALRLGEELGGHLVQGHVEGTVELVALDRSGADVRLTLGLPPALEGGVVPKGSVALDGVSLTVGDVRRDEVSGESFSVYLIPHTLAVTTLAERRVGDRLNLELDAMTRAWEQRRRGSGAGAPPGPG